ncbi:putative 5-3 exonuclease [Sistotremastrum niveocremeum HHB9708]|uniref:Putative 5-3 exonuclease n=1 Tax=Sistotremastrum niveocremeum HHB9708 TaxID=1314777 RepID=A0A164ZUH4_9AGAM|nr:putative 5-3 exonuclease [Sistotremastrum niveocremeum HHB9708]
MGVPALFRWLQKKYPKIVIPVVEEVPPNPNRAEYDNLYLDMNAIVHPCTHPEGRPPPRTEEEMMMAIFAYTERIVAMIRPRKLLFMAVDGVAPRAKMNQQRSRRFRSAQEANEKQLLREEGKADLIARGVELKEEEEEAAWDSNQITPGTPFMSSLAAALRYWAVERLNNDPGWKDIKIIISDASVPGEEYVANQGISRDSVWLLGHQMRTLRLNLKRSRTSS